MQHFSPQGALSPTQIGKNGWLPLCPLEGSIKLGGQALALHYGKPFSGNKKKKIKTRSSIFPFLGHAVELPFVFHTATLAGFNYTQDELTLANTMVQYWTNFAHYGNPNGPSGHMHTSGEQV